MRTPRLRQQFQKGQADDAEGNVVKKLQIGTGMFLKNPLWEGEMTMNFNGGTSESFTENLQVNWYVNEHLRVDATLGLMRSIATCVILLIRILASFPQLLGQVACH